jgi:hypothetical protein
LYVLGLSGVASNLGQQQINAKGGVLVLQVLLHVFDLVPQHVGRVAHATNDTETTSVRDGGSKLGAGGNVHAGQQDGVLDAEHVGNGGPNLLYLRQMGRVSNAGAWCGVTWKWCSGGGYLRGDAMMTVVSRFLALGGYVARMAGKTDRTAHEVW